jgi:hypothetical protein
MFNFRKDYLPPLVRHLDLSPSRPPAFTDDQDNRSPKPLFLWSCAKRGRIRFLRSTLHATTPNFHDVSSSIQDRRCYVLAYFSSPAPSSSLIAHRWLRTTTTTTTNSISLCISITSNVIFPYKRKVHATWSNLFLLFAYCVDHDYLRYVTINVVQSN